MSRNVNSLREPFLAQPQAVVNLEGTDGAISTGAPISLIVDRETVRAYLTEMFLGVPGLLQIWTTPAKGSGEFFTTDEDGIEQAVTFVEAAGNWQGQQNIYARITTLAEEPDRSKGSRGPVSLSSHFIGLWTDIDFGTLGHEAGDALPPDAAAAQAIYDASGLPEASLTVHSGGGLYHIVKLADPIDITDTEIRMRINALSRRWQQRVKVTAEKMGYKYGTGVSDLARVLRIPGTINAKDWNNRRRTAFISSGVRYTLDELEAVCPVPPKPVTRTVSVDHGHAEDARARMNQLLAELRATTFERNNALNRLAYMCFQYAGAGQLDAAEVEREFTTAGLDTGLEDREVHATVQSAMKGMQEPFAWTPRAYTERTPKPSAEFVNMWEGQTTPTGEIVEEGTETPVSEPETEAEAPAPPPPPIPPDDTQEPDGGFPAALPRVEISNERDGLANMVEVINKRALHEVYVRDGRLVHVGAVSGARNGRRKKVGAAIERTAPDMGPSQLRALMARYTYTWGYNAKGEPVTKLPSESLCKAVLSGTEWPGLDDLVEITPMPFVREDGTICQKRGYDEATGVWLNVDEGFPEVPDQPTDEDVAKAKDLLLNKVLRDFPFVGAADRANYMGLLSTPALMRLTGNVVMLGVLTAAAAGSGKSLLAEIISRTYGGNGDAITLPRQDEELRKLITTQLVSNPHAVITFDNIGKSHRVDSPVLSSMLTLPVWSDRLLGGNENISRVNDKLWLATGNNVQFGGEMASRSCVVRIDPKMERPDKRDTEKFALGNLQTWMSNEDNRIKVMHALLVLIKAWAAAGMPQRKIDVRTFTPWASNIGGLLDFHGIHGFLTNRDEVDEADEESYEWAQFLSAWHARHGEEWMTTAQLTASYRSTQFEVMSGAVDPWNGSFPLRDNGQPYTNRGLGMKLKYILDRPFQGWVLRKQINKSTNMQMWRAERMEDESTRRPPPPTYEQPEIPVQATSSAPHQAPVPPAQRSSDIRSNVNILLRTLNRPINITYNKTEENRQ